MIRPELPPASRTRTLWVLRVCVAAALTVSAVIHVQLAPGYQQAAPGGLGQGTLFLVQAGAAALAAVFVLLRGSRTAFAAAAVMGFSSLAAVILYRYVQVPAIGPLPSMYEPVWYTAKTITAVAEAIAGALALTGFVLRQRKSHSGPTA
ncbi:putative membrane protein YphA (DoxX/SURF4 family) [Arthrobacter sp. MP_M7]|nr:putative membrane protein YphA (DoxX/SURF4 family) [Arthrobacter sp. MP_M4]MEC5202438.1 putative membrane protein YphA (DoxX/SURF4 family) [Arthrobacter sp. MP_M7]